MKNNVLIALIILIVAGVALYIYFNKNKNIQLTTTVNNNPIDPDAIAKNALINKIISPIYSCDYYESDRSSLQQLSLSDLKDLFNQC